MFAGLGLRGATAFKDGLGLRASTNHMMGFKKLDGQKWNVDQLGNCSVRFTQKVTEFTIDTILVILILENSQSDLLKLGGILDGENALGVYRFHLGIKVPQK